MEACFGDVYEQSGYLVLGGAPLWCLFHCCTLEILFKIAFAFQIKNILPNVENEAKFSSREPLEQSIRVPQEQGVEGNDAASTQFTIPQFS